MKKIKLTQGKYALVDNADYEKVNQMKWYASYSHGNWYARSNMPGKNGKRPMISMHRFILSAPRGIQVDHQSGDSLDNRRENIRLCTNGQNGQNRKRGWGTSKFKGVSWDRFNNRWRAQIQHLGKVKHLGNFLTEADAAVAYDMAALKYHGGFAKTNKSLGLLQEQTDERR